MYRGWPFTGWGLINVPSTIQKRLLKFLLKRALGQFLSEDLDLELDVQLSKGLIHLKELQLNVEVSYFFLYILEVRLRRFSLLIKRFNSFFIIYFVLKGFE